MGMTKRSIKIERVVEAFIYVISTALEIMLAIGFIFGGSLEAVSTELFLGVVGGIAFINHILIRCICSLIVKDDEWAILKTRYDYNQSLRRYGKN